MAWFAGPFTRSFRKVLANGLEELARQLSEGPAPHLAVASY
jgi:hypothetical protein